MIGETYFLKKRARINIFYFGRCVTRIESESKRDKTFDDEGVAVT
jgi:hypothetical protein